VFTDPNRDAARSLGLDRLPAFVFVRMDGKLTASAQGWDAKEWRGVADEIAKVTAWTRPNIPAPGDPAPFAGTPALTR
jgi:hypothetical protein